MSYYVNRGRRGYTGSRGGSFKELDTDFFRSTWPNWERKTWRYDWLGFRPALSRP